MRFVACLILLSAILTAGLSAADYQQVRIYPDTKDTYHKALKLGLDIVSRTDTYLEIITNEKQLGELRDLGIRTEVIHADLVKYYRSRLDLTKDMGGYLTWSEINDSVDDIITAYPNIVSSKYPIGQSIQGRTMYAVRISDNPSISEGEPQVLITAAVHAREVITPLVLLNVMRYLTANYGVLPEVTQMVDNREIWFVPNVNPDGYYYNQQTDPGGGGMWRKNRRNNGDGSYGIDINRNFGYQWGYDDEGSSPYPDDETYRGTGPFSEPETQNMRNFTLAHNFVYTVYLHSYSSLVLWPWGYDYLLTPDNPLFIILGDSLVAYNGYTPEPSYALYTTNGGSDDWGYGEQVLKNKNLALTIEVGNGSDGFWPDPARIPELVGENLGALLFLIRTADDPYLQLPPEAPELFVADTVSAASYDVTWESSDTVNPAVFFELAELTGFQRFTDLATNFNAWTNVGFTVSTARSYSSPSSFYSGSGNNLQRTMTTEIPVSIQPGDTLRLRAWYNIEQGWDYAYVEVSPDGQVFTPIAGSITTNDNPNGQNRGNGITGNSGGWVQGIFPLTSYAGQSMYLRLSYCTDGWVAYEGIYFDNVYPVESFDLGIVVSSTLVGDRYTFTNHAMGDYWYQLRAQDAQGQWSHFSPLVHTVVTTPDSVCYDTDGDGYGDPGHPENTCPDDNCPLVFNPDQTSSNGLSEGDACCCHVRGDTDHSGVINIQDLVGLVGYMFQQGQPPLCPSEGDINGNGVGPDIADLLHLVNYMFQSGPEPAACL